MAARGVSSPTGFDEAVDVVRKQHAHPVAGNEAALEKRVAEPVREGVELTKSHDPLAFDKAGRTYPAAMKEIGNADRHEVSRRLNNRAENSHQPFRRRERAMQRFRSGKMRQKFSSVRSTTISTGNVISSPAKSTHRDARPRSASARAHGLIATWVWGTYVIE